MKTVQPKVLFCLLGALVPSLCAAGVMRQYNDELTQTIALVQSGAIAQAVAQIEKTNEGPEKDLLYFFEKGELLSIGGDYTASRDTWLKSDEIVQAWENDFRLNSAQLFGNIGSYLISDKTRRYDGQDYEKVLLSTRLTLNHILLGNFALARIEMKKTYEREKLIEAFREQEYDALKVESEKQETGSVTQLDGYPMAELDTPEVRELKNGYQNAFAHYLAGYFFEATNEPSLAEPGYRNALQLAPGKALIQNALNGIGKKQINPEQTDVLFVVETGFAPRIESLNIPIPIPRKDGVVVVPLSFPVIKSSSSVLVPPSIAVAGQQLPVETLTNTDTMARRLLKDQMPGIILRTVIRATLKSVVQEQANKAHWLAGLIANVITVGSEQADDRCWRSLPERISIARTTLPQGKHLIEFQSNAGSYRSEIDIAGRFTIVPIRITGTASYVGHPHTDPEHQTGFVASAAIAPQGAGLPAPVQTPVSPASSASATQPAPAKTHTKSSPAGVGGANNPGGHKTITWDNGDRYEGQVENGLMHGKGVFVSPSKGFRYEGDWVANKQHGRGKTTFDVGDVYVGEMKDGEFHGQGSYTTQNGSRYEGGWNMGIKEGQGRTTFPDGDYWEGIYSNGKQTDQGKMTFTGKSGNIPSSGAPTEGAQ